MQASAEQERRGPARVSPLGQTEQPREEEFPVLDLLIALARHPWIVLGMPAACVSIALAIVLLLPPTFKAQTRILATRQDQTIASMFLNQMGGMAGVLAGNGISLKDPNAIYVAMLKSRRVAETIVTRERLAEVYKVRNMTDAVRRLAAHSSVESGADSVITIEVEDHDPARAARVANDYVQELERTTSTLVTGNARQRRSYFESELEKTRESLAQAEADLRHTQEKTGFIDVPDQARAIIGSVAGLRAQISAAEVELQGMESFAGSENPDVLRLQNRLRALRAQLTELEKGEGDDGNSLEMTGSKVPKAGQEYIRSLRQVRYYEAMYELISKQYEMARLEESNSVSAVQVMDTAFPPEERSSPKRLLTVFLTFIFSLGMAVPLALAYEKICRAGPDSALSDRLRLLQLLVLGRAGQSAMRWRRPGQV